MAFPREGSYASQVYDGFEAYGGLQTHTYAPVEVAAPGAAAAAVLGSRHRSATAMP